MTWLVEAPQRPVNFERYALDWSLFPLPLGPAIAGIKSRSKFPVARWYKVPIMAKPKRPSALRTDSVPLSPV